MPSEAAPESAPPSRGESTSPAASSVSSWRGLARFKWRLMVLATAVALTIPAWRSVTSHAKSSARLEASSPPLPVAVARVTREDLYSEVTIPAEFRPYNEVQLHAKVSGYLDRINVDFGDQVKAGQLVAQLEVPELRDELDQALAAQKRAEADYWNTHLAYTRLQAVDQEHPNLLAQQELDTAEAKDRTAAAALAAAKADAEKYQAMLGYTRITAPFDGVITRRYVDPGVLIQAGTSSATQSLPLVCVSDNYRLRLDFPVSVAYVKDVRPGTEVEVRVDSLDDRRLTGKISRCTQKVDESTRTMTAEIEVPNSRLEFVPGMYATVVLKADRHSNSLSIPTEAVSSGQTSSVYLVNAKHEIEERPVTLGLETPNRYEVLAGLMEGELVFVGSRSQVHLGQKVEVKTLTALAEK